MATLPAALDFALNPQASPARMNLAMAAIDQRLRVLEAGNATLDQLLAQLQAIGLARINDALQPYYQALKELVSLGSFFNATSVSQITVGTGTVTFVVDEPIRDQFAFSGFMIAVSAADSRNAMMGRVVSYDRSSGLLTLQVMIASGSGVHADWTIMPSAPPFVPAAVIDPGTDGGAALAAVPYALEPGTPDVVGTISFDPGTA